MTTAFEAAINGLLPHRRIVLVVGAPASAQVIFRGDSAYGGRTIHAGSRAEAFMLAAAKLTGIAVPSIPLWADTMSRITEGYMQLQDALISAQYAHQPIWEVEDARRRNQTLRDALPFLYMEHRAKLTGADETGSIGDKACALAALSTFTALGDAASGLRDASTLLHDLTTGPEAAVFKSGPLPALFRDLQLKISTTLAHQLAFMGVDDWITPPHEGGVEFQFPLAMVDAPSEWAERMAIRWIRERPHRIARMNVVLESLADAAARLGMQTE